MGKFIKMPLTEKTSNSVKKSDTKPRTPAKTTGKKGSSNTKENQTLLTSFLKSTKSTPAKNEKEEIKNDDKQILIRTSPRNKTAPTQVSKTISNQLDIKSKDNQTLTRTSPRIKTKLPQVSKTLSNQTNNDVTNQKVVCSTKLTDEKETNLLNKSAALKTSTTPKNTSIKKNSEVKTSPKILTKADTKTKSPAKKIKVASKEQGNSCNLDKESHEEEDKVLIKTLNFTKEELELKETNDELFWEQTAEKIREQLSENLEDNKQLFEIQQEMESEGKDLVKQQDQLMKLADEAGDICREFMVLDLNDDNEVDDSGIID